MKKRETSNFVSTVFYFELQNRPKQEAYWAGDHIADDNIYMDITSCNIKGPQQKNNLGTFSNRFFFLGGGGGAGVIIKKFTKEGKDDRQ